MKQLSYSELSTLLAGLRMLQDSIEEGGPDEFYRRFPHFDDVEPLTSEQIDDLCERLNTSEITLNCE